MQKDNSTEVNTDRKQIEVKLIVGSDTVSLWWDNSHVAEFGREWYEQTKSNAKGGDRVVETIVSRAVDEHTDRDSADIDWTK
ncbi:hypothetical protein GCM10009067_40510 [Haloarcula sebkhae]|uniref:Uncharacterized protein n=1 Tax=Haloarcula sebkhae TaxID=932660 RepID=A0A830EQ82_9EURY|nr:hypothetical protein GCM10009067_40510 [Haloarcula sebkhae]